MAKIKISELATELGCESKEIVSYLQEKGVEAAKRSTSSIEDTEAAIAKKHFKAGKSSETADDKKPVKKAPAKKENTEAKEPNKVQTAEAPKTANESSSDNSAATSAEDDAHLKKKKKIIFVSNPNNSRNSGNQGGRSNNNYNNNNGNNRPQGGYNNNNNNNGGGYNNNNNRSNNYGNRNNSFANSQNTYHPIKPKTAPSQLDSYENNITRTDSFQNKTNDRIKKPVEKEETTPEVRTDAVANTPVNTASEATSTPVEEKQTASAADQTRTESQSRPDNNGGSYNRNQNGYNNNRPQGQNGYNNNRSQGQGGYNNNRSQGGYNNNRPQGQGGYNNNRPQGQGGYNNNRPQGQGGYNNNRPQGQGGYNNNRPQGQGGYNNNRPQGQGGYNNNRPQGQGGYNNRGQGGQGGFNGRPSFNNNNGGGRFNNNGGGYNNNRSQGGYAAGQGNRNGAGNRFGGNNARPGQGNRFGGGEGFTPTSGKDGEKHREEEKRRQSQERDKRSRKTYEDEELMPRSKRVGRFIKPEIKKVEEPEEQIKVISVADSINIKDLADKMKMQPSVIIKKLFLAGQIVTVNTELTYEEAENIAIDYDIICEKEIPVDVIEELLKEDDDTPESEEKRPPVVCVMGHVDHGKTSLLDAIRKTSVTEREAGGITQKIGAYTVKAKGQNITFLDTPGHEAFTAMRMRGANSTDIAVLVVAADDGVMPQTIEAINHAKAANVEIIVAVNKIDKPNANIDRVKQEMTEYGLIATDWGGTTEFVPVSAKTGEGIETLLETILLTADILELKANPNRMARGLVLEAKLDKGRGPVANILVQKGTLQVGDFVSAGASYGKVRAMADDKGKRVKEALPSQPVEILGLSAVPNAGEVIVSHESDKEAKNFANTYLQQHKKDLIDETKAKMSLDDLYSKIEEGKLKELDIIIKADVQGSAEALKQSLIKLSNDEVVVKIIHNGVGAINESDVTLAAASDAIIIGFDVRPDATAKSMAEHEGVEIKLYKVIYQAIDDVDAAMKGMLAPIYEEKVTGHAEIRQIFKASAIGNIAGAIVTDGNIQKGCKVRISRADEQIFEGNLASLKRFKDDVKEVKEGYECGLVFEDFDQMNEGDIVEAYTMVEVPRT